MRYVRLSVLPAVAVGWLLSASSALASGSTLKSGYSTTPNNVAGSVAGVKHTPVGHTVVQSGTLPFTGMNLMYLVLAAAALIVVGLAFRRIARNPS